MYLYSLTYFYNVCNFIKRELNRLPTQPAESSVDRSAAEIATDGAAACAELKGTS
jgi:hypothetical protein